jgi:hypothetical protein
MMMDVCLLDASLIFFFLVVILFLCNYRIGLMSRSDISGKAIGNKVASGKTHVAYSAPRPKLHGGRSDRVD